MQITFYCQRCDHAIDTSAFATLDQGKCPKCKSIEGFSTLPKAQHDPFIGATIVNDTELLEKMMETK